MHRCLSVCEKHAWKLIHISETVWPTDTKFRKGMDVDDPNVNPECQVIGQRSMSPGKKNMISGHVWPFDS